MIFPPSDTLIIGAGAAGLIAARELGKAGRAVTILEARERVGGRIWSRREPDVAIPVEVGAEFIHGRSPIIFSLLREAGMPAIDAGGSHWTMQRGRLKPSGNFFGEIQRAMKAKHALVRKDVSFEVFLDRTLHRKLSEPARRFARMLVEGFDAADPARASARAIAAEWTGGGAANEATFRPLGGFGALMMWLTERCTQHGVSVEFNTVVQRVRWARGRVEVEGVRGGQPFRASAKRAVVTLPLAVLQLPADDPHAVAFDPCLKDKQGALTGLASGPVHKVALHFRSAFWEEIDKGRYRDAAFFHAPQAPFPTFWTALPVRTPGLVAWAGGPQTSRAASGAMRDVVADAVDSAQQLFGKRVDVGAQLETAYFHDWQRDPYARGAYSYVTVGGEGARKGLAAPLSQTLFFAGEAVDVEGEAGTVAGALQSGLRAARQILRA